MGLTFTVGNPSDAFTEPFAENVRSTLASQFGNTINLNSEQEPYFSQELGWSGWRLLQETAVQAVSAERVPHLLSMEAWCGCYVPADTEPGAFHFDGESTPLDVASLNQLASELESVGIALGLPTTDDGLCDLYRYYEEDDRFDDDMQIQTYAQLLLAAHTAQARRQVLWIVK
jgi:hypothetical protein